VRLWYLQIHLGEVFTEKSRNNQLRVEYLFAPRGFLRDRNGELLADVVATHRVEADRAGADLDRFLADLVARGLLRTSVAT